MIGLFRWVHPDFGIRVAHAWSNSSRAGHGNMYSVPRTVREYLLSYCEEQEAHYRLILTTLYLATVIWSLIIYFPMDTADTSI